MVGVWVVQDVVRGDNGSITSLPMCRTYVARIGEWPALTGMHGLMCRRM